MQRNSGGVWKLFFDPPHVGEAVEPNVIGRAGSFQCGAILRVSLHIDESQRIVDAKFKAAGCSVLVTSASLLIGQVIGKTTGEAAAVAQNLDELQEKLGNLPPERSECALLACEALISAIRNYSDSVRDEWNGDEALICTCFCVSEKTIEHEIRKNHLRTVAEVTRECNAGGGCRSCHPLIEDIMEEVNRKW